MLKIQQLIQDMCPNGVEWKTLDELGTFYGGLSGKTKDDFKDGNAKYITYLNIGCNPALRFDILETVKVAPNEKQNAVQYGDALFTGSSETPDECAMSSVVTEHPTENIYLNSFCFGFRFNSLEGICPAFYKHYFRCGAFRKAVRRTANGTTRFNVSKKEFAKLEIPLPPLEIQQRIVEVLDRFSALAAELQAELQKRRTQYEYYRTRLLTPPPTENISSDNSTDESKWEWKTLGEVCKFQNGFAFQSSKFLPSGKPILRITNIKDSQIDDSSLVYFNEEDYPVNLDSYKILPNRIVIAMSGATTGKVGMNRTEQIYYMNQRVGMFIPDELIIDNNYLFHYLSSQTETLYYLAGGGAQPNLSTKAINELQIPLPSLTEQKRIAELLNKLSALTTSLSDGIPAEQAAQQKRYEYYRDLLLTFPRKDV